MIGAEIARAADEATVLELRATTPAPVLALIAEDERRGVDAYRDTPGTRAGRDPRAVLLVCDAPDCPRAFWTRTPRAYCSAYCQERVWNGPRRRWLNRPRRAA